MGQVIIFEGFKNNSELKGLEFFEFMRNVKSIIESEEYEVGKEFLYEQYIEEMLAEKENEFTPKICVVWKVEATQHVRINEDRNRNEEECVLKYVDSFYELESC